MGNPPTDDLQAMVGMEVEYRAPEPLGKTMIRYFAQALRDPNPIYLDDEYARAAGYPGVIAPPTLICETNQYTNQEPNAEGYVGHLWDLPIEGAPIRGGHEYEFHRPVLPTDRISATFRIAEVSEMTTSKGDAMLRIVSEIRYTSDDGDLLATNREIFFFPTPETSQ